MGMFGRYVWNSIGAPCGILFSKGCQDLGAFATHITVPKGVEIVCFVVVRDYLGVVEIGQHL